MAKTGKKKIACVVGARPNFMKVAPLMEALGSYSAEVAVELVHTGQHYDERMSGLLFEQLEIPEPDVYLEVGSDTHARQTANVMVAFEDYCKGREPDVVVVVGDVNSTLACSLVAAKLSVPVVHVEAGLRSRDRAMPEEVNRIVTDVLSDLLFTTCREADRNLLEEGIPREKIHFVGNVMIDSLRKFLPKACPPAVLDRVKEGGGFGVVTLHRPSNVDDPETLRALVETLCGISTDLPLILPSHPRTSARLRDLGYDKATDLVDEGVRLGASDIWVTPPLGYLEFLYLLDRATVVFTDSGGIQEETTVLGTPCLTLRENTERPITIEEGTNVLAGQDPETIRASFENVLSTGSREPRIPEKWEGGSAVEIAGILVEWLRNREEG
jgi:UDP-N-acetylglucosamine 2-epimerase (non-hydrolysing)